MRITTDLNTYITLKNEDGSISNEMQFIFAKTGQGKSCSFESLIEEYHNAGYVILILSDVKDEFEFAYSMFEPKKPYHINHLRKIGKPIKTRPVKIYHPFTFSVPKEIELPEINFYGFSIKELHRSEWSMIAETAFESDTIRLLLNSCQNLGKNDGLYAFMHLVQDSVTGKRENKSIKADPKNFYLNVTSATAKSLQDIVSYLLPFKHDYFLVDDNSDLKLNWKDILADQEHYHFFTSYWLQDEKLKEFCILALFNAIIRNKRFAKKPILICIPEIRKLVPFKPEGYKKFLAFSMKNNLSIMRNQGKGMSGLFDAQVWQDVDENVRNSGSVVLYGELGGASDIEKVSKALNYKREIREKLKKMPYKGTYIFQGAEDRETFTTWLPGHMHKEEDYNFFEMYKMYYPNKMHKYKDLVEKMIKHFDNEETKFKEKVKKKLKEEKEARERIKAEREKNSSENKKVEKIKDKLEEVKDLNILEKQKSVYLLKQDNPDMSWRKIGQRLGMHHKSAQKYYAAYSKSLENKSESEKIINNETQQNNMDNTQDFEDEFLEEEQEEELEDDSDDD